MRGRQKGGQLKADVMTKSEAKGTSSIPAKPVLYD